jgi:hypothetical protein
MFNTTSAAINSAAISTQPIANSVENRGRISLPPRVEIARSVVNRRKLQL